MAAVGIIDDRVDVRDSTKKKVKRELKKQNIPWEVVDISPLEHMEHFARWVQENEIVVLLVDERLNEQPIENTQIYVDYSGHDLVKLLREGYKELPIFIITAHEDDPNVLINEGDFDSVISRGSFTNRPEEFVKRFVRATNKYLEVNDKEYTQLSKLSEKIALGKATNKDVENVKKLQAKLEIPFVLGVVQSREEALEDYEKSIDGLDQLSTKIEAFLKKYDKPKK
jgi:hypothetical protein